MFLRYCYLCSAASLLPAGSCGYGSGRRWERVTAFVIARRRTHTRRYRAGAPATASASVAGNATVHARNVRFMRQSESLRAEPERAGSLCGLAALGL